MFQVILAVAAAMGAHALPIDPNPAITPGHVNPAINQFNLMKTICTPGYTAGSDADGNSVRNVTAAMKRQVMRAYGVSRSDGPIEIDHRVPLEDGGSNDISNLWPETRFRVPYSAWDKDKLENRVHAEICSGRMTLQEGENIFLGDWKKGFDQYIGAAQAGK